MGTSSPYGGPSNNTPLVPSWLEPELPVLPPLQGNAPPGQNEDGVEPTPDQVPTLPVTQPPVMPYRFRTARSNLTRFVRSDGKDKSGLYRGISQYVSKSSGGARQASRRMGSSRRSASRLLGFLSNVVSEGAGEALRTLNFSELAGRPIGDIFLGLIEYICPDGGNIDEGIARDAFIETIVDLAKHGITDLNTLSIEQLETVFELYVTHTIENRIYNDIAAGLIQLPSNARLVTQIQAQLQGLIQRGVADSLANESDSIKTLRQENVQNVVSQVYESTFAILKNICDEEAEALTT